MRGRPERNKKTGGGNLCFSERSAQGVEWLFTEKQTSCFRLLVHSAVQKQPQLRRRVIEEPKAGATLREKRTEGEKKKKKKMREKQERDNLTEQRARRGIKKKKRKTRGRGYEG